MLTELHEADATGDIATIYAEIRQLYATPYVSSIHRHMATRPGVLPWAWGMVAPAFRNGVAQSAGWQVAADARLSPLSPIPPAARRLWGVADADVAAIIGICESFMRVAPVNLVFGGLVRALMQGARPGTGAATPTTSAWQPPLSLPPPPPMADVASLGAHGSEVLELFRRGDGATAFVPGLYRMLARWPALLAHLATELGPRHRGEQMAVASADLLRNIDAAVEGVLAQLPAPAARLPPAPDSREAAHLNAMIDTYRQTSPEMILFGGLIREAVAGPT